MEVENHSLSSLSLPRLPDTNKRRLLLVYIHGFMGSEASFHDLPVHVHDLLTDILSQSHVVYTRIYPRYKSHGEIQTAVTQFSDWISPHEADDLDVILLGHSLGGILAADIALLQAAGQAKRRHRILGIVNFDVPFLGLHPRVIPTGISSLIPKGDVAAEDALPVEQEPFNLPYQPFTPSPNFDPPFVNDIRLAQRGFFKGMMHFVSKNTDNLSRSIFNRMVSSVKFANCVNNFPELRRRYRCLMELEAAEQSPERLRFVNYYTASTGRMSRKPKAKPTNKPEDLNQMEDTTIQPSQESSDPPSVSEDLEIVEPIPITSNLPPETQNLESASTDSMPVEAATSEKCHSTVDTTIVVPSVTAQKEENQSLVSISTSESDLNSEPSERKLRKFILLPSHHWKNNDDAHWIPIVMENMDEVTAHQSMFIPQGTNYSQLVGDTVALIEQWVQNDLSQRLLQQGLD